jgi:hypothetical protein
MPLAKRSLSPPFRSASAPMPVAPLILPADAPIAVSASLGGRHDRRVRAELGRQGGLCQGQGSGLNRNSRQGYPAGGNCNDNAHVSIPNGASATVLDAPAACGDTSKATGRPSSITTSGRGRRGSAVGRTGPFSKIQLVAENWERAHELAPQSVQLLLRGRRPLLSRLGQLSFVSQSLRSLAVGM